MRREDVLDILKRVPPNDLSTVVFNLTSGATITLEAVARAEPEYLVFRGREGGTTDEGRAFFLPYADILYLKVDRVIKASDLKRMYGEAVAPDGEEKLAAEAAAGGGKSAPAPAPPPPAAPADPAAIARANLLERIRSARTAAGGPAPPANK